MNKQSKQKATQPWSSKDENAWGTVTATAVGERMRKRK